MKYKIQNTTWKYIIRIIWPFFDTVNSKEPIKTFFSYMVAVTEKNDYGWALSPSQKR